MVRAPEPANRCSDVRVPAHHIIPQKGNVGYMGIYKTRHHRTRTIRTYALATLAAITLSVAITITIAIVTLTLVIPLMKTWT